MNLSYISPFLTDSKVVLQNCIDVQTTKLWMSHQLRSRQRKWFLTFSKTRNISWSIYHILYIKTFDCQKNRKSVFLKFLKNYLIVSEKWSKYILVILESKSGNWFENNWGIQIPRSKILVFESNVKWLTHTVLSIWLPVSTTDSVGNWSIWGKHFQFSVLPYQTLD